MVRGTRVEPAKLVSRAVRACYQAKLNGRNQFCFYNFASKETVEMTADAGWSQKIQKALKEDAFVLHYQPIVNLRTRETVYYEVLLRMLVDDDELAFPATFLPTAARLGLMVDIDRWVIRQSLRSLAALRFARGDVRFTLNVSGSTFDRPDFFSYLETESRATGVPLDAIVIEITEQTAMRDLPGAALRMAELVGRGCRFAIDDFGSGYCSYSYLKNLPLAFVKIDGSFIANLAEDGVDQKIVAAITEVAAATGCETIAEHVKDYETLRLLEGLGVTYGQGYFLGKPAARPTAVTLPLPMAAAGRRLVGAASRRAAGAPRSAAKNSRRRWAAPGFLAALRSRASLSFRAVVARIARWRQRHDDDEVAAVPEPAAPRLDGAAMHLEQPPHQREPDAQAAARRALAVLRDLREQIEDPRQLLGWNSVAGVDDAHDRGVVLRVALHDDPSARLRVLVGVAQQIRDDLRQPVEVADDPQRRLGKLEHELVFPRLDRRRQLLGAGLDRDVQVHRRAVEGDLAAADPCEIEQIVDEARQVRELPMQHRPQRVEQRRLFARVIEQLQPASKRGERVSQLVPEHGEELALILIRSPQVVLMLPQPVVVPGDRRGQRRVHGAVEEREPFGHVSSVGFPVPRGQPAPRDVRAQRPVFACHLFQSRALREAVRGVNLGHVGELARGGDGCRCGLFGASCGVA